MTQKLNERALEAALHGCALSREAEAAIHRYLAALPAPTGDVGELVKRLRDASDVPTKFCDTYHVHQYRLGLLAADALTAQAAEIEKWKRLDREAATHVESVICLRSKHFTGEPPYVGWKGLGLALTQDYDALTAQAARIADVEGQVLEAAKMMITIQSAAYEYKARADTAEARIAELERERDEAQHLLAHTREWNTDWVLKNKERVAAAEARISAVETAHEATAEDLHRWIYAHRDATARAERLEAALRALLACPAIADGNHIEPAWYCQETVDAERGARTALADSAPTPAQDAGYVLAPREPTSEMRKAACKAMSPTNKPEGWVSNSEKHAIRYRAMIEASQQGGDKS